MYWLLDAIHWHMCYDDASTVNACVALHNKLTIDLKKKQKQEMLNDFPSMRKESSTEIDNLKSHKKEQKQASIT